MIKVGMLTAELHWQVARWPGQHCHIMTSVHTGPCYLLWPPRCAPPWRSVSPQTAAARDSTDYCPLYWLCCASWRSCCCCFTREAEARQHKPGAGAGLWRHHKILTRLLMVAWLHWAPAWPIVTVRGALLTWLHSPALERLVAAQQAIAGCTAANVHIKATSIYEF